MGKYYHQHTILYHNGAFVKATEASMDLYSQSIHYGYCVFEGIRAYKTVNGTTKIFKAAEHYSRLAQSAAALNMPYHWLRKNLFILPIRYWSKTLYRMPTSGQWCMRLPICISPKTINLFCLFRYGKCSHFWAKN